MLAASERQQLHSPSSSRSLRAKQAALKDGCSTPSTVCRSAHDVAPLTKNKNPTLYNND
jgi:hypothetical protein